MGLEEVAKAVEGGYCRLQMPLRLALAVRGTVAEYRLSALQGVPPPFQCIFGACTGHIGKHGSATHQPHFDTWESVFEGTGWSAGHSVPKRLQ